MYACGRPILAMSKGETTWILKDTESVLSVDGKILGACGCNCLFRTIGEWIKKFG